MIVKDLKILILCGGRGERLKPLTDRIPKPLININGKPILYHLINYFQNYGFIDFILATGYKSKMIEQYFEKNHKDINVTFSNAGDVDIIERILYTINLVEDNFILCYGDTLANIKLDELIKYHNSHNGQGTITTYQLKSPFGVLQFDESGLIHSFIEKPVLDTWINIGYFLFCKDILEEMVGYKTFAEFLSGVINKHKLYNYKHKGIHITVNTMKELKEAEKNIKKFEY